MNSKSNTRFSVMSAAFALVAALLIAPSAFARGGHHGGGHHGGGHHGNWGVSIGFSGPGYSIGYSDCRHCGRGYGSSAYYGGYYTSPYYAPSYYSSYYSPAYNSGYYDGPYYGSVYYNSPRHYRHHRPVTRRVVHYNNYGHRDRDDRRHDGRRDDHRRGNDYGDRDRQYSRARYYGRD
jgi:hypothetical protein